MARVTEAVQKTHRPCGGAATEAAGLQETTSGRTGGWYEAAGTDVDPRRGAGRAATRQAKRSRSNGETSGAPHLQRRAHVSIHAVAQDGETVKQIVQVRSSITNLDLHAYALGPLALEFALALIPLRLAQRA